MRNRPDQITQDEKTVRGGGRWGAVGLSEGREGLKTPISVGLGKGKKRGTRSAVETQPQG